MNLNLTKGWPKDRKDELEREFKSSTVLRKALVNSLQHAIDIERNEMEKPEYFQEPNWENAHINKLAYIRALKKVISMLN